jgi:hypothetical protein
MPVALFFVRFFQADGYNGTEVVVCLKFVQGIRLNAGKTAL